MKKLLGMLVVIGASLSLAAMRFPSTAAVRDDFVTEPIEMGRLTESVSATGLLQPRDAVIVGGDGAGRAVKVFVELHQAVKAQDPLLQLDDRVAQLRLQQARIAVELALAETARAEAARDAAQSALQRARDAPGQLNPTRDTEQFEISLRGAEAGLRAARVRVREGQAGQLLAEHGVEMTVVRAPIAGVVIDKRVMAGQQVAPPMSANLITLAPDLEKMQAIAHVAEGDVGKIQVGQPASFTVNAWPDVTFEGKVTRIAAVPLTVGGAVQYPVTVDATNVRDSATREWRLRSGMPASIDLVIRCRESVWKLPAAAATVHLDETKLSENARKKLERWKARGDVAEWQRVWTVGADKQPWPLYLRTGFCDGQFHEVQTWDPEETAPTDPLRVLIAAPASAKPDKPGMKFF